jgi:hypothetical protein
MRMPSFDERAAVAGGTQIWLCSPATGVSRQRPGARFLTDVTDARPPPTGTQEVEHVAC